MKRHALAPALWLGLMLSAQAADQNLSARFELSRGIEGTFAVGQRGRLVVGSDIFGQSRNFPNDLRIFGEDGSQWPFFLHVPRESAELRSLEPEILNRSFVPGSEPYLQFDLVVPSVDGKVPVHNRLELATSGRDFVRRVEVSTGQPPGRMATGYLIDFSRQRNAKNQTLRYPDSDVARLHVRIYSNAQSAEEPFDLVSARLHYRAAAKVGRETVDFVDLDVPEREQQKGASTRILDVGETDRPVEFITFAIKNQSYARCVSIFGRNDDHEPWRWVGGGEIHALAGEQENTVKLGAKDRFLKIHVFHYDDAPLDIAAIQLEAIPRYLVFEAASAGRATLCFRAWDIDAPRYDLKGRVADDTMAAIPLFQTLETQANSTVRPQPWRKYSKLLGGLAVAGVSLLVLWIIASMLRQQRLEENK
ncbi:MAG: DUF3999 domain-containing protein [Kiritimatiellales bacterium]|nr:DUF3999 domain-containing protein [Kiritimatiellales bacterium]MCF7864368.1 DUF3999 domain-containing protein [Kiritimatiellales bacterium]